MKLVSAGRLIVEMALVDGVFRGNWYRLFASTEPLEWSWVSIEFCIN